MNAIRMFSAPCTGRRGSSVTAYAAALIATSVSTFAYVFAVQRVITNNPMSGLEGVARVFWTAGLVAPVAVALKGVALAAILWAALTLFDVKVAFARCMAIAWWAECLLVIPQFICAMAGLLRGATRTQDLFVPLGLDVIWRPNDLPLGILSHSVTIFFLAWIAFVWSQLRRQTEAGARSWPVALGTLVAAAVIILLPVVQLAP